MGSLLKVAVVGLATIAAWILLPTWFPSLRTVAFANAYGITWATIVTACIGLGGTAKLTAK